jgi:hypothetical protein
MLLESVDIGAIERLAKETPSASQCVDAWLNPDLLEPNPWAGVRRWLSNNLHIRDNPDSYFTGWSELMECLNHPMDDTEYLFQLALVHRGSGSMPQASSLALIKVLADILNGDTKPKSVEEHKQRVLGLMTLFKLRGVDQNHLLSAVALAYALHDEVNQLTMALHENKEPRLL